MKQKEKKQITKNVNVDNVFEAISRFGHDEDFVPPFPGTQTNAYPGTKEKIEIMRARVQRGEPIFNKGDRIGYQDADPKNISSFPGNRSLRKECTIRVIKTPIYTPKTNK